MDASLITRLGHGVAKPQLAKQTHYVQDAEVTQPVISCAMFFSADVLGYKLKHDRVAAVKAPDRTLVL